MTPTEAKAFLKDNNVKYILAQFVDIHGVAKTKSVPAEHLDMILTDGAGFAGFAAWGLGQGPQDHDFMAIGDLDTLSVVPWQPGYARLVCDGTVDGKPWPFDTREVMKRQLAKAAARGWTINTGTLANGSNIVLDASNKAISINSTSFGSTGIQLQYNGGTPRFFAGTSGNHIKYNGSKLIIATDSFSVDASGNTTMTGTVTATAGNIGGFGIGANSVTSSNNNEPEFAS